jgi:hypothetical protein
LTSGADRPVNAPPTPETGGVDRPVNAPPNPETAAWTR